MDWKKVDKRPKEPYGWFAAATLPRNHSGSDLKDRTDLDGDNSWRKSFGFVKAWYNNGEWYEPDATGHSTNNITRFVTHWDHLPEVPLLKKTFFHPADWRYKEKPNKEHLLEMSGKEYKQQKETSDMESFNKGFLSAMRLIGIY